MIKKPMQVYTLFRRQRDVLVLFLLALVLYSVFRFEFLLWNWSQYQHSSWSDVLWAFFIGLRFDLSANCYLVLPLFLLALVPWPSWLWPRMIFCLFFVLQLPLMILNTVDIEFINFVGRRFTKQSLFILNEATGKVSDLVGTYALVLILQIFLFVLFFWFVWKKINQVSVKNLQQETKKPTNQPIRILVVFLFLIFYVMGSRGGVQKKPISFVDANVFSAPVMNNLVLNTSFTILKSFTKDRVAREKFFTQKNEFLPYLNGSIKNDSLLEGHRAARPQNVVILIMESFSLEYMGKVNGVKGYTPFLDELSSRPGSLFFKNGIANSRRSIEGIAAVITGIPALMSEPFISSEFTANYFIGLGSYVAPLKYHTSFFHGGMNGTMHFDSFMKSAGIENYFGSKEFPDQNQNDGTWGIFDEPFFQFYAKKTSEFTQPFASVFFSLSSHHPYKVPEQYKDKFPTGPLEILPSIGYADFSLKKFFAEAEKQSWYKDTLFIITADHTQKSYLPNYENEISKWKVPVIFFHPHYKWPKVDTDQIVQHIDILPSILDFMGIKPKEEILLGRSVFIPGDRTATTFVEGRYMLIAKDYFLDWSVGQDFHMFDFADVNQQKEILDVNGDPRSERRKELIQRLKASVQYFNEGMWDNRLYYPTAR